MHRLIHRLRFPPLRLRRRPLHPHPHHSRFSACGLPAAFQPARPSSSSVFESASSSWSISFASIAACDSVSSVAETAPSSVSALATAALVVELGTDAGRDDWYGAYLQKQNHASSLQDHGVKVPPRPPPPLPTVCLLPPHSPGPLPTPPLNKIGSTGGSGSNYSGSDVPLASPSPDVSLSFSRCTFTYEEMAMATDGFSDANLLGQGGFGYVHRGVLANGKEVAIKQLKIGSGQGEREFQAEVEIITRVHHRHLVSLVGYCISGGKRLLVYEYVPNNTLDFHLHGKGRPTMEWPARWKIALGSAKGLAYLHEDWHLVNAHFSYLVVQVADFGLAKFASDNNTHVSTRVMGTFGYLAPEYASSGKLTDKSDVFSFGVMLLELITGHQPLVSSRSKFLDDSLVEWARPLLTGALEDGNYDSLIDPKLGNDFNPNEMTCMIACAAACVQHSARRRPKMSQIVRALQGDVVLEDLNEQTTPAHNSSELESGQYNDNMKFRKVALAPQENASSEYSQRTSENNRNPLSSNCENQQTQEIEASNKNDSYGSSGSSL
ncbi:hypothetical protein ZIOFF_054843 [Zingiber officinale]|uniref:non-specific serine/threonine protein kinase n=1 Tax=Zingiber officinale TaxID=94328 RepID=A0A8J5KJU0_ZINOF|nr:hypothetical protein ZIOFF_054843 [Zingiber officinale]